METDQICARRQVCGLECYLGFCHVNTGCKLCPSFLRHNYHGGPHRCFNVNKGGPFQHLHDRVLDLLPLRQQRRHFNQQIKSECYRRGVQGKHFGLGEIAFEWSQKVVPQKSNQNWFIHTSFEKRRKSTECIQEAASFAEG